MVPIKQLRRDYKNYLKSEWWQERRLSALKIGNYKCVVCSKTKSLQVHHLNYEHLYCERDEDLEIRCDNCHKKIHKRRAKKLTKQPLHVRGVSDKRPTGVPRKIWNMVRFNVPRELRRLAAEQAIAQTQK